MIMKPSKEVERLQQLRTEKKWNKEKVYED